MFPLRFSFKGRLSYHNLNVGVAVKELDLSGLDCPMPLLKAKRALNEMVGGDRIKILATDPGSVRDFDVFAKQSGNLLLETGLTDGVYFYLLQKKNELL